jgi:hypothetical protein
VTHNPYAAYQPYRSDHVGRPQNMALAAMLAGRGVYGNPMDARRQLARQYGLLSLLRRL